MFAWRGQLLSGKVLVIDDDSDIDEVVRAVLTDAGYEVTVLTEMVTDAIAAVVGRLEPDAILLDGEGPHGFGTSWQHAAAIANRERPIPLLMFSAHPGDLAEARAVASERTKAARFAGVIAKPFELDELLETVARAVGSVEPFDTSAGADAERTQALVAQLERIGARDARGSTRREWVTFRTPRERVIQVYWWQSGGCYLLGRYERDGKQMENVALTYDRPAAIEICAALIRAEGIDASAVDATE